MSERYNKESLLEKVVERTGVTPDVAAAVVDAFLDEIYQAIKQGQPVTLRNFGTFYIREERSSRVFKFSPSQKWRAMLGWSSTYKGVL
ncbi:MAG: HU family DNA-binding protein [Chloroflexi bacterium]|nr:HU family DNA-binding protein [Chloroflexota bacterium]